MIQVEAPGKVNLSLLVGSPREDGHHTLDSLVQTIEWCDLLEMETVDDDADTVTVSGGEIDPEDNLIHRALQEMRTDAVVPPLMVRLEKTLPIAAGLGGGSSDAAATILGAGSIAGLDRGVLPGIATRIGADVLLFLTGGTLRMGGVGDVITPLRSLDGFAMAVAVPAFGLSTVEVYRRWDQLEGPTGVALDPRDAPPSLRGGMPLRNDLLPAALSVEPRLGDFMADLKEAWGIPVCLTGSGSGCFGYFTSVEEASDAARAVVSMSDVGRGVALRRRGVAMVPSPEE